MISCNTTRVNLHPSAKLSPRKVPLKSYKESKVKILHCIAVKMEPSSEDFDLKVKAETTFSVSIPDFSKEIDDVENKKKSNKGPKFKVGEKEFIIAIKPENLRGDGSHIGVYQDNLNEEKIKVGHWRGLAKFLLRSR